MLQVLASVSWGRPVYRLAHIEHVLSWIAQQGHVGSACEPLCGLFPSSVSRPLRQFWGSEHQYIATRLLQPCACAWGHLCMVLTLPGFTAACMNFACLTTHMN